jgi:hypothetical protein
MNLSQGSILIVVKLAVELGIYSETVMIMWHATWRCGEQLREMDLDAHCCSMVIHQYLMA